MSDADADAAWREKQDNRDKLQNPAGETIPADQGNARRDGTMTGDRPVVPSPISFATQPPSAPEGDVEPEVLPCPFCGERDGVYSEIMGPHVVIVRCSNCNATHCCKTITEVVKRWNCRSPAPQSARSEDEELGRLLAEADAEVFKLWQFAPDYPHFKERIKKHEIRPQVLAALERHRERQSALAAKRYGGVL